MFRQSNNVISNKNGYFYQKKSFSNFFCLQDTVASVASAFSFVGFEWAWYIATVGAIVGISARFAYLYCCLTPRRVPHISE